MKNDIKSEHAESTETSSQENTGMREHGQLSVHCFVSGGEVLRYSAVIQTMRLCLPWYTSSTSLQLLEGLVAAQCKNPHLQKNLECC